MHQAFQLCLVCFVLGKAIFGQLREVAMLEQGERQMWLFPFFIRLS